MDTSSSSSVYSSKATVETDFSLRIGTLEALATEAIEEKMDVQSNNNKIRRCRHISSRKWSRIETARFYQLLQRFGTDFLLISMEMKTRSKKEVLNKYKKESSLRRQRVLEAFRVNYTGKPLATLEEQT